MVSSANYRLTELGGDLAGFSGSKYHSVDCCEFEDSVDREPKRRPPPPPQIRRPRSSGEAEERRPRVDAIWAQWSRVRAEVARILQTKPGWRRVEGAGSFAEPRKEQLTALWSSLQDPALQEGVSHPAAQGPPALLAGGRLDGV